MMTKKRRILILFLILFLSAGALVYIGQRRERAQELYYSGTIEATQANLAFETSGRVKSVSVQEGEVAKKGQLLAELDPEAELAQIDKAQANLDSSIAKFKQVETLLALYKKTLPAEVDRVAASVKALKLKREEAESGYRKQEVEEARLAVDSAAAAMEEAGRDKVRFDRLFEKKAISQKEKDRVDLKYETAYKTHEQTKQAYDLRKEGFRKESVEMSRANVLEGQAILKQARNNLKKIDVTQKEVTAARAAVQEAAAALNLEKIRLSRTRLKAPFDGIVTSRNIEPGEVITPTREVLSISNLARVDLKVFVDETEIGKVKPGQKVDVKIDTSPDKTYDGTVAFISPESEFTPKIIQTHKERIKLVYRVKISIPNPDLELKSGMPADAWFR